jgi:Protein of unknown function (DUF3515)
MRGSPPRLVLAVAVVLPLLLALAAAVVALVAGDGQGTGTGPGEEAVPPAAAAGMPLALPAVAAPAAGSPQCAALLTALPQHLPSGSDRLDRRPLAEPAPPGAAAWGVTTTVVLRCGLDKPAELIPTAALLEVSGVQWLRLRGPDSTSTWVAVDRPVYVALTLSDDSGTGPLQDVSEVIRSTLDERPVEPVR